jgi:hypothetical protein
MYLNVGYHHFDQFNQIIHYRDTMITSEYLNKHYGNAMGYGLSNDTSRHRETSGHFRAS